MNILLIGFKNDIDFVYQTIKDQSLISQTILWDKNGGPDFLTAKLLDSFSHIIIAIAEPAVSNDICELIRMIQGSSQNAVVINFYQAYRSNMPAMKVDKIMQNHPKQTCDGMILGISHAEVGLVPRCFDGSFCNLALTSQDLYFNLKTLEECCAQYPEKIKNLQYLIFDLYDYTYFNFDTSLSRNAGLYYSLGGYLDAHNFEHNKIFNCSFENLIKHIYAEKQAETIPTQYNSAWKDLFPDIYTQHDYLEFPFISTVYLRTNIIQEKDIENYYANTSIVEKIYHETIQENIEHFYTFLELAYRINPNIKLYFLLLPRYYHAQQKGNALYPQYAQWKEMFYTILNEANKQYPFTLLDLKNHEISKERLYYYDVSHFNYYGAVAFSRLVNSLIR